jgi:hypothetical protein
MAAKKNGGPKPAVEADLNGDGFENPSPLFLRQKFIFSATYMRLPRMS